jgi:CDP-diacylglycerol--glycerol-3-phosphate 3-phosphatidyltransferase
MSNQSQQPARILPKKLIIFTINGVDNLANLFVSLKITPNALSVFALILGLGAGILFSFSKPLLAGIVIVFCGLFDMLDGKVAVKTNKKSLFGAIFDSTLDRYSEFFIYLGLAYFFRNHWALWLLFFTFLGSSMVSYTRARAEGLGIECKIGVMQRAERMVLLASASILGSAFRVFNPAMIGVLIAIAIVSNITAFQRTFYVRKVENLRVAEQKTKERK